LQYVKPIVTYLNYLKSTGGSQSEINLYTEVLNNEIIYAEAFTNLTPGGNECWGQDDQSWTLMWFDDLAQFAKDNGNTSAENILLANAWTLYGKIFETGQSWGDWATYPFGQDGDILLPYLAGNDFRDRQDATSTYAATTAYASIALSQLDAAHASTYLHNAKAIYDGIKDFCGRNDGLYNLFGYYSLERPNASPLSMYDVIYNDAFALYPYDITADTSASFIAGNMAMVTIGLYFGDNAAAVQTIKAIDRFESMCGGYMNDRDGWTNGAFAGIFANTIMSSGVVPQYLKDIQTSMFKITVQSMHDEPSLNNSNSPGSTNDTARDGILSENWYFGRTWDTDSFPQNNVLDQNATTLSFIVAAMVANNGG